jgi:hypothetical protein
MSANDTGASGDTGATTGRNIWDFLTVLAVLGVLVVLTIFLVKHYSGVKDAASILGIVTPVLGGAFGVVLGYATGNATGQTQGANTTKAKIKRDLAPVLDQASETATRELPDEHQSRIAPPLEHVRGYLNAL